VTTPPAARHTLMPLTQNFLATVSSERRIDDIGDFTYVRCGKVRIPFSETEEYSADNRVTAE
jgi:hypothetical protein